MSVYTFLTADCPLPTVSPSRDYPLHINIDTRTIDDGGADDNFFLLPFPDADLYSDKTQSVALEWPQYTPGRAQQILSYMETALTRTEIPSNSGRFGWEISPNTRNAPASTASTPPLRNWYQRTFRNSATRKSGTLPIPSVHPSTV